MKINLKEDLVLSDNFKTTLSKLESLDKDRLYLELKKRNHLYEAY